jgi:hypothetical protein
MILLGIYQYIYVYIYIYLYIYIYNQFIYIIIVVGYSLQFVSYADSDASTLRSSTFTIWMRMEHVEKHSDTYKVASL